MMDFDQMAEDMMSHFPMRSHLIAAPGTSDDDEFFKDLPVAEKDTEVKHTAEKAAQPEQRA